VPDTLPYHEHELQLRGNNMLFCIVHYRGSARRYECITERLTSFLGKTMTHEKTTMDSKIIDITHCKTYKKRLLVAECMILTRYYHQSAITGVLYDNSDGPAGRPSDNPPNSNRLDICVELYPN
jgi:hypothetical protein